MSAVERKRDESSELRYTQTYHHLWNDYKINLAHLPTLFYSFYQPTKTLVSVKVSGNVRQEVEAKALNPLGLTQVLSFIVLITKLHIF